MMSPAFFGGVVLALTYDYENRSIAVIRLVSIHPVTAFSYGLSQIGQLEESNVGLTGNTLDLSESRSGYSFRDTLGTLLFDILLWGFVTWYLNRVIKPDYGQALPPWFLFTRKYWCPSRAHLTMSDTTIEEKVTEIPYEEVGENQKRQAAEGKSIEIHDLRKTFGDQNAVDGLNLEIFRGEITALLGHNGTFGVLRAISVHIVIAMLF